MDQIWIDTIIFSVWFAFSYLVIRFMPVEKTYKKDK